MDIKRIGTIAIFAVLAGLAFIFMQGDVVQVEEDPDTTPDETNDIINGEQDAGDTATPLAQLPQESIINGRAVVFDNSTVALQEREEYAQLPYEIEVGEETRLVESDVMIEGNETPIDMVERFLSESGPGAEELETYPESMYERSVSLYSLDEELLAEYPGSDDPVAEPAEEGVSVVAQTMNLPDDSIGGNETRFDFIVLDNGGWLMVWQGERVFCRRMDNEFWQPADQLCP